MTDLLTRQEYAAIAADLALPRGAFIDGKFRAGNVGPGPGPGPGPHWLPGDG